VAWFCRAGKMRDSGTREPCTPPQEAIERFQELPRGMGGQEDGFQFFCEPYGGDPAVHAGLYLDGQWVVQARYVRGSCGVTNFTAQLIADADPGAIAEAFRQGKARWVLAPWLEKIET